MRAEAFAIHLARAIGRAPQVERLRTGLPLPVSVLDAVDGRTLTEGLVQQVYRRRLHRPRYPFALGILEIACFLSHRKAWQAILDRGLDAGLVVEDDVEIDEAHFPAVLAIAMAYARPGDVVRFPKRARGETGQVLAQDGDARIVSPRQVRLGMQAVLVGRDAAATLLSFTRVFDRPVDTTIQMHWLHGVPVTSAMPVAIREVAASLGGSTVQRKGKPLGETLAREFHRTRYRFAVRLASVLRGRPDKR